MQDISEQAPAGDIEIAWGRSRFTESQIKRAFEWEKSNQEDFNNLKIKDKKSSDEDVKNNNNNNKNDNKSSQIIKKVFEGLSSVPATKKQSSSNSINANTNTNNNNNSSLKNSPEDSNGALEIANFDEWKMLLNYDFFQDKIIQSYQSDIGITMSQQETNLITEEAIFNSSQYNVNTFLIFFKICLTNFSW